MNQEILGYCLPLKTESKKSRETVPLTNLFEDLFYNICNVHSLHLCTIFTTQIMLRWCVLQRISEKSRLPIPTIFNIGTRRTIQYIYYYCIAVVFLLNIILYINRLRTLFL
jgi:hypothetical protein